MLKKVVGATGAAALILVGMARLDNNNYWFTSSEQHRQTYTLDQPQYVQDQPWSSLQSQQQQSASHRSQIHPKEFFGQTPSEDTLCDYFCFQPSHNSQTRLRPLWSCPRPDNATDLSTMSDNKRLNSQQTRNDTQRHGKVIVLQMYRSASSWLRTFFRVYTHLCGRSMVLISQCVDLGHEYLTEDNNNNGPNSIWRNGRASNHLHRVGMDCWLTSATDRQGNPVQNNSTDLISQGLDNRVSTNFLKRHDFDIVAGSVPLGCHEPWMRTSPSPAEVKEDKYILYIVLLRDPLEKFVSQCLQSSPSTLSAAEAVELVYQTAERRLEQDNYVQVLSNYLVTPEQRDWAYREFVPLTPARRVNLTLSNLLSSNDRYRVLIGLTDRLAETVELLAFVLDGSGELEDMMGYFSSMERMKASTNFATKMSGEKLTKEVVRRIDQDESVSRSVRSLLQYDQMIYDAARQLHMDQYAWMKEDTLARKAIIEENDI